MRRTIVLTRTEKIQCIILAAAACALIGMMVIIIATGV